MNMNELKIAEKYKKQGYKYIRGGAPDFVFFKVKNNEIDMDSIKFVEVKYGKDRLSLEQQIYKEILILLGCTYELEYLEA